MRGGELAPTGSALSGLSFLERLLGVELEWNPLTRASRAARAERAGRLGEALRLYFEAGHEERLLTCIRRTVPDVPHRAVLLEAAGELVALRTAMVSAAQRRVVVAKTIADEVADSALALWDSADRLTSVSAQVLATPRLKHAVEHEVRALANLVAELREARSLVTEAMLTDQAGADRLTTARDRLRAQTEAVREVTRELS
ncbi:MAG: hypothetical protein HY329_10885 [Chloroflexi bacterium]|nr:hypothetical protein [Chloroflexota bacterium]